MLVHVCPPAKEWLTHLTHMTHHESPCLLFPRANPSVIPRRWMRFRPTYLANSRCHASCMSSTSWSSWALVDRNTSSNSHVLIDGLHFKKTFSLHNHHSHIQSKSKTAQEPCKRECWLHFSRKPFWTSSPWHKWQVQPVSMSHGVPWETSQNITAAPCYVATVRWEAHWCPEFRCQLLHEIFTVPWGTFGTFSFLLSNCCRNGPGMRAAMVAPHALRYDRYDRHDQCRDGVADWWSSQRGVLQAAKTKQP